jgi:hypothetical protein
VGSIYPLTPQTHLCMGAQLHHRPTFAWVLNFFISDFFCGQYIPLTPGPPSRGCSIFSLLIFFCGQYIPLTPGPPSRGCSIFSLLECCVVGKPGSHIYPHKHSHHHGHHIADLRCGGHVPLRVREPGSHIPVTMCPVTSCLAGMRSPHIVVHI